MVSLNKPSEGNTDWASDINENWTSLESAVIDSSIATTKGDLLAATASSSVSRLGVGSNDDILIADSAESVGSKWSDPTSRQMGRDIGCRIKRTTSLSVSNATVTIIDFDAEDWDTDSMHDNSINNNRVTFNTDGKYLLIIHMWFNSSFSANRVQAAIRTVTGGANLAIEERRSNGTYPGISLAMSLLVGTGGQIASGGAAEATAYQDSGSSKTIDYGTMWFSVEKFDAGG